VHPGLQTAVVRLRALLVRAAPHAGRARALAAAASAALRRRAMAEAPIHPLLRNFAVELNGTLARIFAYGCAVGAVGLIAVEVAATTRGAARAPQARPEWVEAVRPFPAFALSIAEFEDGARYAIRRHAEGGRKDILAFGDLASGAAAEIEIYRPGGEAGAFASLDAAEAAGAGELRLSGKPVAPTLDSKFGPVVLADFTRHAGDADRQCLRFTRSFAAPRLRIAGWFCNAGREVIDRRIVACALDRLSLLAAGSDPKLAELFARAELKRHFCGQNGPILAATPKRSDWIEAARDPKLRGRMAGR
jgi:hypothetical protein